MKALIAIILFSFLFNIFAQASEEHRSITTKSGEPPPPPPPWSLSITI